MKSKGEKARYVHVNAEFQRIARRDNKAFLSNQCKEIEENNRMGKTRDLFKKIRDTKGTFHAKLGSIKDRNGMDLTEAEDIKRGGKNTQKNCTKKIFMTQIIMIPKKGNAKECSNYCTTALISHTRKVRLKILQNKLQQYMNHELPDFQAGFRKGRGTRDQIAKICWTIEKASEFQKASTSTLLTMLKPLTVWIMTNCGKFLK